MKKSKIPAQGGSAPGGKNQKSKIWNSGFSFIEVLATVFIIGMVLVLYQTALGKSHYIRYAKNQEIALQVASNKIEELRAGGYDALPGSSSFSDSQLDSLLNSSAAMTITSFNANTKEVLITIQWDEPIGSAARSVSLTTLITETGGL
jgi:prepilin-type N-terminal cleavage/methylation domain-containing protein